MCTGAVLLLFGRAAGAISFGPVVRHFMVARCSAHLLAGDRSRPVPAASVTDLLETLSTDARLDILQQRRVSRLLAELASGGPLTVTQAWRGTEEIAEFLRGMDAVTAETDGVLHPHLRPARHLFERAVYAASVMQVLWESALMVEAHVRGDRADWLYHNAVSTIGFVTFFGFDLAMARVQAYRVRRGWRAPADGATDRSRRTFEAQLKTLLEPGMAPSPVVISRFELVTREFARALRNANSPAGLRPEAIDRLIALRDRFTPVILDLTFRTPYALLVDYVFIPDVEGQPGRSRR